MYERLSLTQPERDIVLSLVDGPDAGIPERQLLAEVDGDVPAALTRLRQAGYAAAINDGEACWELQDRGWRWFEESVADPGMPRQVADAGDTERILWAVLHDQYQYFLRQKSSMTWAQFLRHIRRER